MNQTMRFCTAVALVTATVSLLAGCSAFKMSVEDKSPTSSNKLTAKYDQGDLLTLAKQATEAIFAHPFPAPDEGKPIIVEMGILNRTTQHLDTKALADTMTTAMLDSKQVQIVDASLRDNLLTEQGYQLANCTPETRRSIGKQLGAKYMMTGSITEIETKSGREVSLSKKQDVFLQLTVELTDLETGLIAVRKQVQRMREASKPIIGW